LEICSYPGRDFVALARSARSPPDSPSANRASHGETDEEPRFVVGLDVVRTLGRDYADNAGAEHDCHVSLVFEDVENLTLLDDDLTPCICLSA
jgi:hypothetical protein